MKLNKEEKFSLSFMCRTLLRFSCYSLKRESLPQNTTKSHLFMREMRLWIRVLIIIRTAERSLNLKNKKN